METIQTLVRNLAVILLIAAFLELLLPNKSMRGFVQLVMGLFVISALLNPITQFLNLTMDWEIPAWTEISSEDMPVLAQEGEGGKMGGTAVQEQYRQILVNQIEALSLAIQGVKSVEAEIEFAEDAESVNEQPPISKVNILISRSGEEGLIEPVKPVVIDPSSGQKEDTLTSGQNSLLARTVQEQIAAMMGIDRKKIVVQEVQGG